MPDIFISYRREDSQAEAGMLRLSLEQKFGSGCVFLDTSEINPGDPWPDELQQATQEAKVMFVLIGVKWLFAQDKNSGERRLSNPEDWVRQEVTAGLSQAHTRVIPLLLGETEMPKASVLPNGLQALPDRQHHTIRPDHWDNDLRPVLAAIEGLVQPATPFRRITPAFLEIEQQKSFLPEDFFGALPGAQWWGLTNDYYADVHLMPGLLSRVRERLDSAQSLIAGIICGTGGMGKTTLAREVARRLAPDVQVWWLDPEEQEYLTAEDDPFEYFDAFGATHLVVLDDWAKYADAKSLNKTLARCSKNHPDVKFLITTRQPNTIDKKDPGSLFRLDTDTYQQADIAALYEKLAAKFRQAGDDAFLTGLPVPAVTDKPFHFLFVALRLRDLTRNRRKELFAAGDNYEVYFYEIVRSDILRLAESPRTRGLAVSLVGYALLHHHLRIGISISAFFQINAFVSPESEANGYFSGKPTEQWDIAAHYLTLYEYDMDKYKRTPEQVVFKKDDFYGTIVQLAEKEHDEAITALFHPDDLAGLGKFLIAQGDDATASKIYYYACNKRFSWLNETEKEQYFYHLLERMNGHHAYMQTALHSNVRLPFMTDAAIDSLIPRFLAIAPENIFLAQRIVQWAKDKFKGSDLKGRLLALHTQGLPEITEYTLAFLSALDKEEAIEWAEKLLKNDVQEHQVQCRCLDILKDHSAKKAVEWAEKLLENDVQEHHVQCRCLDILKDHSAKEAVEWAEKLLENDDQKYEVQCRCLDILKDHSAEKAVEWAEKLLDNNDQKYEVQCRCLDILGPLAAPFARTILDNWEKANPLLLRRALKVMEITPEANRIMAAALTNRTKKGAHALLIRVPFLKTPFWVEFTRNKIKNWNHVNRRDVVLCMNHYPPDDPLIRRACQEMLGSWRTEIANPRYNYHLLKALSNPFLRDLMRARAREMQQYLLENPYSGDAAFKRVIDDIVVREEWQEWILADEEMLEEEGF